MKIRAVFEAAGSTAIELLVENEGERNMINLFKNGTAARLELIKDDNRNPSYQKVIGAKIIIPVKED